jgi:hypothetical protein
VNDDGRRAGASLYIVLGGVAWKVADGPARCQPGEPFLLL